MTPDGLELGQARVKGSGPGGTRRKAPCFRMTGGLPAEIWSLPRWRGMRRLGRHGPPAVAEAFPSQAQ